MKKYLLLQDDVQSGPFSIEEIKSKSLQSTDLVWVLGVSNGWTYASEIEELAGMVQDQPGTNAIQSSVANSSLNKNISIPDLKTKYRRSLSDIKEMYVQHLQKSDKTKKYKFCLAAAAFAILVLGGLLIKKIVDGPKEIEVKVADVSSAPSGEGVTNSENFQNALSKEFVPVEVPKPKKPKPKDLKKMVAVETNDYHVRLLGGINDLKLTVQNYSDIILDKVVIRVDYLKPKGGIVNSEEIIAQDIKPMESKILEVPPSSRGVKIKYSVISVHSKEYKSLLEEI
jgi:hypothetical protein